MSARKVGTGNKKQNGNSDFTGSGKELKKQNKKVLQELAHQTSAQRMAQTKESKVDTQEKGEPETMAVRGWRERASAQKEQLCGHADRSQEKLKARQIPVLQVRRSDRQFARQTSAQRMAQMKESKVDTQEKGERETMAVRGWRERASAREEQLRGHADRSQEKLNKARQIPRLQDRPSPSSSQKKKVATTRQVARAGGGRVAATEVEQSERSSSDNEEQPSTSAPCTLDYEAAKRECQKRTARRSGSPLYLHILASTKKMVIEHHDEIAKCYGDQFDMFLAALAPWDLFMPPKTSAQRMAQMKESKVKETQEKGERETMAVRGWRERASAREEQLRGHADRALEKLKARQIPRLQDRPSASSSQKKKVATTRGVARAGGGRVAATEVEQSERSSSDNEEQPSTSAPCTLDYEAAKRECRKRTAGGSGSPYYFNFLAAAKEIAIYQQEKIAEFYSNQFDKFLAALERSFMTAGGSGYLNFLAVAKEIAFYQQDKIAQIFCNQFDMFLAAFGRPFMPSKTSAQRVTQMKDDTVDTQEKAATSRETMAVRGWRERASAWEEQLRGHADRSQEKLKARQIPVLQVRRSDRQFARQTSAQRRAQMKESTADTQEKGEPETMAVHGWRERASAREEQLRGHADRSQEKLKARQNPHLQDRPSPSSSQKKKAATTRRVGRAAPWISTLDHEAAKRECRKRTAGGSGSPSYLNGLACAKKFVNGNHDAVALFYNNQFDHYLTFMGGLFMPPKDTSEEEG